MFKVNDFFATLFNKSANKDEDGVYHYLLEESEEGIYLDTTDTSNWDKIDLSNKIILDCDDDNYFSLIWRKDGKCLVNIQGTKLKFAEFIQDEYMVDEVLEREESILLYSDTWTKRYLKIDLKPYISISLEIDYDQYDTDENGFIIWE